MQLNTLHTARLVAKPPVQSLCDEHRQRIFAGLYMSDVVCGYNSQKTKRQQVAHCVGCRMTAFEGFADVVLAVGIVPSLHRPDVRFLSISDQCPQKNDR